VSRSLLNTNLIGNVTKPVPSDAPVAWMAEQSDEDLLSSLTVAGIRRGILEKLSGKKRGRWRVGFGSRVPAPAPPMAGGTAKGPTRSPLNDLHGCHSKPKRLCRPEDRQSFAAN